MYTAEEVAFTSKALEALQRIKSRANQKSEADLLHEAKQNYDHSRQVFEEYSDKGFQKKVEMDTYIYNQFVKKLEDDESVASIHEHVAMLLSTMRAIYEHINIEPKIYGFKKLDNNSSESELMTESNRIIFEHLDRNYYNLTTQERNQKYRDYVVGTSYQVTINENIDVDNSVEHVYKAAVINTLIENINFPFTIKSKIEELLESQMYKEVFDADTLQQLWEDFQDQSFNLSRILSLTC